MPLTHDDVKVLESKFAPNDHEFLRGYCYITEGGVTRRLDSVDPSWEFVIVNIAHRSDTITVTARLTVKGVTRENTGMQVIQSKDGKESGEPEKGATTDALKRCARLFGIGRYILDLPDTIKDNQSLARYLGGNTQQPSPKQDAPQSAPVATPAPAKKGNSLQDGLLDFAPVRYEDTSAKNGNPFTMFFNADDRKIAVFDTKIASELKAQTLSRVIIKYAMDGNTAKFKGYELLPF